MNMSKVNLDRMDWENEKSAITDSIRLAMKGLILMHVQLDECEARLLDLKDVKK